MGTSIGARALAGILCLLGVGCLFARSLPPRGTPVRRSIERIYVNPVESAAFDSAGYVTWLAGVPLKDLFEADVSQPAAPLDHQTARFTHVENGCIQRFVPNPPDPLFLTTRNRANHCIYHVEKPTQLVPKRDWSLNKAGFRAGTLVAVLQLTDETDAIDGFHGVGSGAVIARVACGSRVEREGRVVFDFGSGFGAALAADFQFQVPGGPNILPGATIVDPPPPLGAAPAPPPVKGRLMFVDSGVWKTFGDRAGASVPACGDDPGFAALCEPLTCPAGFE